MDRATVRRWSWRWLPVALGVGFIAEPWIVFVRGSATPSYDATALIVGPLLLIPFVAFVASKAWPRTLHRSRASLISLVLLLIALVSMVFGGYATAYWQLSNKEPSAFTQHTPMTRTDALYLTTTIFTTTGFGDISPRSEHARRLVTAQMLTDFLLATLVIAGGIAGYSARPRA